MDLELWVLRSIVIKCTYSNPWSYTAHKIKIMENNKNKNNNLLSIVPSLVAPTTYIARGQQSSINFYQELTLVNNCLNRFKSGKELLFGRPLVSLTANDETIITVTVPFYCRISVGAPTTEDLLGLQNILNKQLERTVHLRLVRLTSPYLDATILAEYISNELRNQKFARVMAKILGAASFVDADSELILPSSLVGIKVALAGRLPAEASRPRQTKQRTAVASLSQSENTINTIGSFTSVNYKNAYTVRVWLSHRV